MNESTDLSRTSAAPARLWRQDRGYRPGIAHPVAHLSLTLTPSSGVDFEATDHFLEKDLGVMLAPCRRLVSPLAQFEGEHVVALAWRSLLLGAALQRAVRMPVFDAGCILAAEPGRDEPWIVGCMVPTLDGMPPATWEQCYRLAARTISRFVRSEDTPALREKLREQLHREFVEREQRNIAGGKSTIPVMQAAFERNVPYRHLGVGVYQLGWGRHARLVDRAAQDTDSAIGFRMSQDKRWTASILRRAGLPAARHLPVGSAEEAARAAEVLGWPVVVKPANLDRGEGITVNVSDSSTLSEAYRKAAALTSAILVEEQVPGVCHRLYVHCGEFRFASKRLAKAVRGDGVRSVAELIREANAEENAKPPWERLKPFPADALARRCLAATGLGLESIPAEGELAPLRPVQSDDWGGVVEDMTEHIHPANVQLACRAAALFRLDSAGVDLISEDITRPWYENGAILNEINYAPLMTARFLGAYLEALVTGDGRVPVEAFIGGDAAFEVACARQRELASEGVGAFVTSHDATRGVAGDPVHLPEGGLFERTTALLMDRRVEAVIVVLQTDECLQRGCPVDRFDAVTVVDGDLKDWRDGDRKLPETVLTALLYLFNEDILEPFRIPNPDTKSAQQGENSDE